MSDGLVLTIREAIVVATNRLLGVGIETARQDAWLLLCHAVNRDRATLMAHGQDRLPVADMRNFKALVARRARREPLAHILGVREFWSLPFLVNGDVLCPRPESETVVEAALALIGEQAGVAGTALRILDLGTGSGCLLLSLLHELPAAMGVGVDRSRRALAVAAANGARLELVARVAWVQGDWGRALRGGFDLIVSNPPYVRAGDLPNLAPEVRTFEPRSALVAGADGLDAYRALAFEIKRLLAPRAVACIELGFGQADAVTALMKAVGLTCLGRRNDLAGIDRCLMVAA